jgi:hypothetical protein
VGSDRSWSSGARRQHRVLRLDVIDVRAVLTRVACARAGLVPSVHGGGRR